MKPIFNGKAIYNPAGKAGEYSKWACNFFTGCSNNCSYCYCKKGFMGRLWTTVPVLKKCFKDEEDAFRIFCLEMNKNIDNLRKEGLFFTFTSDPMLAETIGLTIRCVKEAVKNGVPVQILTKRSDFIPRLNKDEEFFKLNKKMIAFGFTLTGCDEMELGACPNMMRIFSMKLLHNMGYRTFASIEPIISVSNSLKMIELSREHCDLFKIGLMSGKTDYSVEELEKMAQTLQTDSNKYEFKFYLKESFLKAGNWDRSAFGKNSIDAAYNIFNN